MVDTPEPQPVKPPAPTETPKPNPQPAKPAAPAPKPPEPQAPPAAQPHASVPGVPDHQEVPEPVEAHQPPDHPEPSHDANTISSPPGPVDMRKTAEDRHLPENYLHPGSSAPEVVKELGDPPPTLSPLGRQRLDALEGHPEHTDDEKKEMDALRKVDEDHAEYVKHYHEMTDKKSAGPFSVEQWRHVKAWMRRELAMHVGGHTERSREVLNP